MSTKLANASELLLLFIVFVSLGLGVTWNKNRAAATTHGSAAPQQISERSVANPGPVPAVKSPAPAMTATTSTSGASTLSAPTATVLVAGYPLITSTVGPLPTSAVIDPSHYRAEPGDAPLLVQDPGTINIMLLGVDSQGNADRRYSRTDTLIIASINPNIPSVSLLSIPRDLQVHIPGHEDDRINTAWRTGYLDKYPGGGPAFLALVLRKNFGIKIDHYVRVDFAGFVKTVDQLGGVQVIAECELHDTFPDPTSLFNGTVAHSTRNLDVYPGKVQLDGYQALMYARSRESTTDFDRARRQQKVIRALFDKVRHSNLLANAIGLYSTVRANIDTDLGLTSVPEFVNIAQHVGDLSIKSRVITYPLVKSFTRADGAMVLLPTPAVIPYIADALSPPAGNRTQTRINVEVVNASGRKDMEAVAADRLTWEGFAVTSASVAPNVQAHTTIEDMSNSEKGSPIPRLASIFYVRQAYIIKQAQSGSTVAARIILGKDYNSCPATADIASEVILTPQTDLIPTSTPPLPATK